MATEKEEIILDFKIEDNDIISQLERTKKVIIGLKEEQKKLTKAYKEGDITLEEYAQDAVRLETQLKKVTATHNENTRAVAGTKNVLTELTKSNKALADQLGKTQGNVTNITNKFTSFSKETNSALQQVNVAGVSVGDLSTKLASFANPATAAVAVVGLLGAAYARSTIGAKDLEFAQNQLSTAITITTNSFARLISSSEDGEGILSRLVSGLLYQLSPALATLSALSAKNLEDLEDLQRKEIEIRDIVNGRLEDNQEKLTQLQAEQTTYNEKIGLTNEIISNLRKNEDELLEVKRGQLEILNNQLVIDKDNESTQTAILEKNREISNIKRDTEKKVQAIIRLEQNLTEAENKRLKILQEEARLNEQIERRLANRSRGVLGPIDLSDPQKITPDSEKTKAQLDEQERTKEIIEGTAQFEIDNKIYLNNALEALETERVQTSIELKEKETKAREALELSALNASATIFDSLSQLAKEESDEQKALALTSIAIDTASAIAGGTASAASIGWPQNIAAIASTIATILANIAQAKSIAGFAEGGYTGPGYGRPDSSGFKPAGIVHENEYVAPKWIVNSSAGSYHVNALESMRLRGYADGGLVTSSATQDTNTAVAQMNALKNLPPPVLSIVEYEKKAKRVRIKEDLSRLKR